MPRFQKKKKKGLTFLPITPTNPAEETDSCLSDLALNGFRDPKAQGKKVIITKHHHDSSDLNAATITGHLSFYIMVNKHSEKRDILLVRVTDHNYQGQLYWCYGMDTRNTVWIPGNSVLVLVFLCPVVTINGKLQQPNKDHLGLRSCGNKVLCHPKGKNHH